MRIGSTIWILLVLLVSCGNKQTKVTREDCTKIADHVAELVIQHYSAAPEELWDVMHVEPGDTGLPDTVTRETLKSFLATPEGKTWLMKRQAKIREGTEMGIDGCLAKATPRQVDCLLAAKTREAVKACDAVK
jgi:hypothetical protein